jgi:hypothetical protein
MGLQPFDAEDFLTQYLLAVPARSARKSLEKIAKEWVQESASWLNRRPTALREFGVACASSS